MALNAKITLPPARGIPEDALQGSPAVVAKFTEMVAQFEQLAADVRALREHLKHRGKNEVIGVRALACILGAAVLQEKLLNFQFAVMLDEAK